MAGVTIEELGLRFVQICMENYWSGCMLPVFFLAGILWDIFYRRRKESRVFLYYLVFLALTVYNPVLVKYVIPKVHFESEYYRFIWILPVIPGAAYYAVRIVEAVRFRWLKAVTALILAAVIVTTGTPVPGIAKDYVMAENIYKVPNELRSVCDVIHQDCDKEQPKVVFDNELNLVARQYDPSLILVLDRNFILYRAGSTVVGNYENSKAYQIQKVIMDVISYQMDVGIDKFRQVLKKNGNRLSRSSGRSYKSMTISVRQDVPLLHRQKNMWYTGLKGECVRPSGPGKMTKVRKMIRRTE